MSNYLTALMAIAGTARQTNHVPFEHQLWDTEKVAGYFGKKPHVARRTVLCLPSFPKAVRTDATAHPLYFAMEVVDWAKSRKEKN